MATTTAPDWMVELGQLRVEADSGVLSTAVVARLGSALFVLSGVVTVLSLVLPSSPGINRSAVAAVGAIATVIGGGAWCLPWGRWPRAAGLVFVPFAFVLIAAHNFYAAADPYRYGLFFIVAFTWLGLCYGRWSSLPAIPLFAVAYLLPLFLSGHADPESVSSVVYTAPVCILVAETVAWVAVQLNRAQASLSASGIRFQSLVQHASDLVTVVGPDGLTQYVSPSITSLTGFRPADVIGRSLFEFIHPDDVARARAVLAECVRAGRGHAAPTLEVRYRGAAGEWHVAESVITNLLDDPSVGALVINARDITERKRAEEQLAHQAFHDPLTDLPNRALLGERIDHGLVRARHTGTRVALLFLDLDNFKVINDSLGHQVGDQLLVAVATRLRACLGPTDTALRFGGDEFAVLLEDVPGIKPAIAMAERVIAALTPPFVVNEHQFFATACIGIALSTEGQDRPDDLLRNADVAMYRAKAGGAGRYEVFDPAMYARALERLSLEQDLRRALERDELRVFYQPVIDFASEQIVEVEALVRWEHPARGVVAPAEFIPLAEETGLIIPIGQWVLTEACRQLRRWQACYPLCPPLSVSVNLSARQFRSPSLIDDVARVLADSGLSPRSLKFEITETVMMEDTETTLAILRELKQIGIQLAVDDFGTGYSSLSYLKRFPADALKIDQSFVRELGSSGDNALVSAMVVAGKALHLQVTIEGIETPEQAARLRELGCDRGQGFLFARPLESRDVERLLGDGCRALGSPLARAADD
ncbi:MAG TPA: EAL domain-containing protein [Thermomicrobiaceae bacterium]|nr:EAL domain-containing protein [Thermomicrobiaceae bacterium]